MLLLHLSLLLTSTLLLLPTTTAFPPLQQPLSPRHHRKIPASANQPPTTTSQPHPPPPNPNDYPPPSPLPDDNDPMIYTTPQDYGPGARAQKAALLAAGQEAILWSELYTYVPRVEGETPDAYTKRYVDTMQAMMKRGVSILNDVTTADVLADGFGTADGRRFRLGPEDGVTKGEYRDFTQWIGEVGWREGEGVVVPERFLRWEVTGVEEEEEERRGVEWEVVEEKK